MVPTLTQWREALERASPTLFALAGMVLSGLLAVGLTVRYTAVSIPRTAFWPLFPLAVALALVGHLGLVPRLVERRRSWALLGGGFAVAGATFLLAGLGALLVVSPPGPYPGNLGLFGAPFFLGLLAFVPAVTVLGVASLQTGVPSRWIGALLVLVGLLQFVELIGATVLFQSAGTAAPSVGYLAFETVLYALVAGALLAVGGSLSRQLPASRPDSPAGRAESPVEVP